MFHAVSEWLSGGVNLLLCMVVLPALFGVVLWMCKKSHFLQTLLVLLSSLLNTLFAFVLYGMDDFVFNIPLTTFGFAYSFRIDAFASLFLAFTAGMFVLISLYTVVNLKKQSYNGLYLLYLYISLGMINGALMADHLGILLFFWEGLLCTLFGMLLIGNRDHPKAAMKALTISGLADLLLMLGILLTVLSAGTGNMSEIHALSLSGNHIVGFVCILLGALAKGGCMPFHSWIPQAAEDAPTAFLVGFPGAMEKILGIYLATRIVTELFVFEHGTAMSIAMMILGTLTIVLAVAMALIQKDMKKLLAYHAISQLGYMVLGIGTGLPVGIMGGLFHMMNNVIYKSGLFMIAGSIEKQTGTTDLKQLKGLGKKMPVTAACFLVFTFSIAGFPGFNGFFSKELVFDAALESHVIFYIGALLGAFMTALSFLKMGRSLFFGAYQVPEGTPPLRETKAGMLIPMSILAVFCMIFGLGNTLPLDTLLAPATGIQASFSGWPHSVLLVVISLFVLLLALLDHLYGSKKDGSPLHAADHIRHAPVLKHIYDAAEKGWLDPYHWLMAAMGGFSDVCVQVEKGIGFVYDKAVPRTVKRAGLALQRLSDGRLSHYLYLAVGGMLCIALLFWLL
ncbi:MAG TPA: proton-conducting membrane transporter [Clostridiales bacterium]|nr:proton-conducting membrane transporter [Clostridiales bacterium]